VNNVSLTRAEALQRAAVVGACEYWVDLDLSSGSEFYEYSVRLRFNGTAGARTFLDAQVDHLRELRWQGQPLGMESFSDQRIQLPALAAESLIELAGTSSYHEAGLGIHLAVDNANQERYIYTDFEPAEAHRTFPCFDQPDLKGRFTFRVRVPQDWTVVSAEPGTQGAVDQEGNCWWSFPPTISLPAYVIGIAAGRLHAVHQLHGDIPLGLYAPVSLADHLDKAAPELFQITSQGLDFYQQRFGVAFPFHKYDQVFCLEKVNGAMESPGCVTITDSLIYRGAPSYRERSVRAEVVLHEMAHMWFGDLATFRWWDDLWLNESFATFMAMLAIDRATSFDDAFTFFATAVKQMAAAADQLSTSHPVSTKVPDADAVNVNFDRITYEKGSAVLRQLAAWVGEEPFFAAIQQHLETYREGNAELKDLIESLERSSGRDVGGWARAWLETVGINTLTCGVDGADVGEPMGSVTVLQTASPTQPTLRPHLINVGLYDWVGPSLERVRLQQVDVAGPSTEIPELRGVPRPPLLVPNDGALTYAKVRLDPISLLTMEGHLADIPDSLTRAVLWESAWDMVRDAQLPSSRFVQLVVAHLPRETDQSLIPLVLAWARRAISNYAAPATGDQLEAMLAEAAASALSATAPGSSQQSAWLRAYIAAAVSPQQVARCLAMANGQQLPPGVHLDLELRWRLLSALATRGAAGEEAIATMTAADPTSGRLRGLVARAVMPSPAAKETVFQHLTVNERANVEDVIGIGRSFAGVRRDDLLLPFVPRFFAAVDALRERRGQEYSRALAMYLLPSLPPHQILISHLVEQLGRTDLGPDLRRLYQERLEEARIAVRARELDESTQEDLPPIG
jgi:aminopeptidase N